MAGNTGYGIYKEWLPEDHLIDVKQVPELRRLSLSKVGPSTACTLWQYAPRKAFMIIKSSQHTFEMVGCCPAGNWPEEACVGTMLVQWIWA